MADLPPCFRLYQLPPFFTLQPFQKTNAKQISLWAELIVCVAQWRCIIQRESAKNKYLESGPRDQCRWVVYFDENSPIFRNSKIERALSKKGIISVMRAASNMFPNECISNTISEIEDTPWLIVLCNKGGKTEICNRLLMWVMEMGGGLTPANLSKNGAILTIEELVDANVLTYVSLPSSNENNTLLNHQKKISLKELQYNPESIGNIVQLNCGCSISNDKLLQFFLESINGLDSLGYKVSLFNLDGSARRPFEGVKISGINV